MAAASAAVVLDASKMFTSTQFDEAVPFPPTTERLELISAAAPLKTVTAGYRGRRNGLLSAVMSAYNDHMCLVLTPDALWACIVTSVSAYLDTNAEALRSVMVTHHGKKTLTVPVPSSFETSNDAIDWPWVLEEIQKLVREDVTPQGREVVTAFEPHFSTSDIASRTSCVIAVMAGLQRYYDYGMCTLCGIPAVEFKGTVDDWTLLRLRSAAMAELAIANDDFKAWLTRLDGTLANIQESATAALTASPLREEVRAWWAHIYSLHFPHDSGAVTVDGWILDFFMYDSTGERIVPGKNLCFDDIPCGWSSVPFTFKLLSGEVRKMKLFSGTWQAVIDTERLTATPHVEWAVAEAC